MTEYTENQPVTIDAWEGPLRGMYVGTRETKNVFGPNTTYLRIRVTETAQGYEYGEVVDALPQRVTPDEETAAMIAMAEDMATRPPMTLAEAERHYRR